MLFKKSLITLSVAALALTSSAVMAKDLCADNSGRITVVGQGEVKVMPDRVSLNYRVTSLKPTADEARQDIEKSVTAFSNEIAKLNLGENAFVADNISIITRYNYKDNERTLLGYEASRNVEIKLSDFSKISQVTDIALKSGINQINGFEYSVADQEKYKAEASQKAIANAKAQAEVLAKGFGVRLVKACNVSFQNNNGPVLLRAQVASYAAADSANKSVYTPEALTVTSSVSASFATK